MRYEVWDVRCEVWGQCSQNKEKGEACDVKVSLSTALTEVTVNFGIQGDMGIRRELFTILHHYTNRVCEGHRKWLHHRATPTLEMVTSRATPTQEMATLQGHTHPENGYITGPHLLLLQSNTT